MGNLTPLKLDSQLTMSSREIADLTGKRHPDVKRDIEKMLVDLEEDTRKFAHIYFDSMNRKQSEHLLDREHTECLLTGYSAKARMKVIKRWHELEQSKPSLPSYTEALRQLADEIEQKEQLALVNKELSADNTRLNKTCNQLAAQFSKGLGVVEFCRHLNGVNTQEITNYLKSAGVFIVGPHGLRPSCNHRDVHFKYSTQDWANSSSGRSGTSTVITLTVKGAKWLYRKYIKGDLPMKKTWDYEYTHNILDDLDFAK